MAKKETILADNKGRADRRQHSVGTPCSRGLDKPRRVTSVLVLRHRHVTAGMMRHSPVITQNSSHGSGHGVGRENRAQRPAEEATGRGSRLADPDEDVTES